LAKSSCDWLSLLDQHEKIGGKKKTLILTLLHSIIKNQKTDQRTKLNKPPSSMPGTLSSFENFQTPEIEGYLILIFLKEVGTRGYQQNQTTAHHWFKPENLTLSHNPQALNLPSCKDKKKQQHYNSYVLFFHLGHFHTY
jgi:hypothetical protein